MTSSYSESELRAAVQQIISSNEQLGRDLSDAIRGKQRGWLGTLVSSVAHTIFGRVIGNIVDRVIDWFTH